MLPFMSYYILPTQTIVKNNIRIGHVKEDIAALLLALSPLLYIFHRDIPKPNVLVPSMIQNLATKPETLKILALLGWFLNSTGEYCFVDTDVPDEIERREKAAREFRKFYNELATAKDRDVTPVERFLEMKIKVPFSSYSVLPAQNIVRANVRIGHVKEDVEALIQPLAPLLHISKPESPRPSFLHSHTIQKLSVKRGSMDLLQLFGYISNSTKDCTLTDAESPFELTQRALAAGEFRRFYDELKKQKGDEIIVLEYFLSHSDNGDKTMTELSS